MSLNERTSQALVFLRKAAKMLTGGASSALSDVAVAAPGASKNSTVGGLHSISLALDQASTRGHDLLDPTTCQALASAARRCRDPNVRILFAGQFSSGKSTLLNALIGRDLLPSGDFPETGCPTELSTGPRTLAIATYQDGTTAEIEPSKEAIAKKASLLDADGHRRPETTLPRRLEIQIAGANIPKGVSWIDGPGLVEHHGTEAIASELVARADLVIFVLRSNQFLTEQDREAIDLICSLKGKSACILAINMFANSSTQTLDQQILQQRPKLLHRLEEYLSPEAPDSGNPQIVAFVNAARSLTDPLANGATALHGLISTATGADHPTVRLARISEAQQAVALALNDCMEAHSRAKIDHTRVSETYASWRHLKDQQTQRSRDVRQLIESSIKDLAREVLSATTDAATSIGPDSIKAGTPYVVTENAVNSMQQARHAMLVTKLRAKADGELLLPPDAKAQSKLRNAMVKPLSFSGLPELPDVTGITLGSAAVLGGIGFLIGGPFGAAAGAALGGGLGREGVITQAVDQARANITTAGASCNSALLSAASKAATSVARDMTAPLPTEPPTPDARRLEASASLLAQLNDLKRLLEQEREQGARKASEAAQVALRDAASGTLVILGHPRVSGAVLT